MPAQYEAIKKQCVRRRCRNATRCRVACSGIGKQKFRNECLRSCGQKKRCVSVCKATAARITNARRKRRR